MIRVQQHRIKYYPASFTAKYNAIHLGYYQNYPTIEEAILEEKRIKSGSRAQKEMLIQVMNPNWKDLWDEEVSKW